MGYANISSQNALGTSNTTSVSQSYANATTQGNLLIATVFATGISLGSVSIAGWTTASSVSFLSLVGATSILYKVASGAETSITANCSGATSMSLAIHEFSTGNIQSVQLLLDQANSSSVGSLSTQLSVGSVTPTKTNQLIIAACGFPTGGVTSPSWDSGINLLNANGNLVDGYLVDLNVNAINPKISWAGLSTAGGCIVSFLQSSVCDTGFNHVITDDGISISEVAN